MEAIILKAEPIMCLGHQKRTTQAYTANDGLDDTLKTGYSFFLVGDRETEIEYEECLPASCI